jgi:hypothetical protein
MTQNIQEDHILTIVMTDNLRTDKETILEVPIKEEVKDQNFMARLKIDMIETDTTEELKIGLAPLDLMTLSTNLVNGHPMMDGVMSKIQNSLCCGATMTQVQQIRLDGAKIPPKKIHTKEVIDKIFRESTLMADRKETILVLEITKTMIEIVIGVISLAIWLRIVHCPIREISQPEVLVMRIVLSKHRNHASDAIKVVISQGNAQIRLTTIENLLSKERIEGKVFRTAVMGEISIEGTVTMIKEAQGHDLALNARNKVTSLENAHLIKITVEVEAIKGKGTITEDL